MSTAAELLANRRDVRRFIFRAHADAYFAVEQLFEKHRNNDAFDRAKMVDQSFIVFRENAEFFGRLQTQAEARDFAAAVEAHRTEQFAQQFNAASRIAFVQQLTNPS